MDGTLNLGSAGLTRRQLLAGSGAAVAATALGHLLGGCQRATADRQGLEGASTWQGVRGMFELDPQYVHLAGLLLASHPTPVRQEIERLRREFDKDPATTWEEGFNPGEDAAREAAAAYIGGSADDIGLVRSTTEGLALLYNGIRIREDQEFLMTAHDHTVTHRSIELRAAKTGQSVRRIRLYEDGEPTSADQLVGRLASQLRPETRVVALTWVHSTSGMRLPIAEMSRAVADANSGRAEADRILLVLDGVHGFGVEPIDIDQMGCDFLSAGCHKWLFGPRGTGIVWGRRAVQDQVIPTVPTFSARFSWGRQMTPGGFQAFEHRWALSKAFELHDAMGPERVRQRTHELARQCKEGLRQISGVRVYTPMEDELSAGIVCFMVGNLSPGAVVERLRRSNIIASATPYNPSFARFSPAVFNTPDEVDSALSAIRDIA
jgi:isopenicillin-N epimerase